MSCAGLLLTGGKSRRMGEDKARLRLFEDGPSLAARTAQLLTETTVVAVEVGSGVSGLPTIVDGGGGPLRAVATAWRRLANSELLEGHDIRSVLVVATDLPRLSLCFLEWLVNHPHPGSVIPLDQGQLQPLCARYVVPDLDLAVELADEGMGRVSEWVERLEVHRCEPTEWISASRDWRVLRDVDTPDQVSALKAMERDRTTTTATGPR